MQSGTKPMDCSIPDFSQVAEQYEKGVDSVNQSVTAATNLGNGTGNTREKS
jgi:hypothetical protein